MAEERDAQVSQQDIANAPESGEAPHIVPDRSIIDAGADAPHDNPAPEAGVEVVAGTDVPIAPPVEGTKAAAEENVNRLEKAPPPEEAEAAPELPEGAFDSAAFRAANTGAREAFASMVVRPGHIFRDHGGRYVNIMDISEVYEVQPGDIVPDGLFLFPINYLVREEERQARLRG